MAKRAFPVAYASDVERTARFWERLGFGRFFQLPEQGTPGYVGLRRDEAELAVVAAGMSWGERIATVADPDGNPVALANER